jgi:hypothetical protein
MKNNFKTTGLMITLGLTSAMLGPTKAQNVDPADGCNNVMGMYAKKVLQGAAEPPEFRQHLANCNIDKENCESARNWIEHVLGDRYGKPMLEGLTCNSNSAPAKVDSPPVKANQANAGSTSQSVNQSDVCTEVMSAFALSARRGTALPADFQEKVSICNTDPTSCEIAREFIRTRVREKPIPPEGLTCGK